MANLEQNDIAVDDRPDMQVTGGSAAQALSDRYNSAMSVYVSATNPNIDQLPSIRQMGFIAPFYTPGMTPTPFYGGNQSLLRPSLRYEHENPEPEDPVPPSEEKRGKWKLRTYTKAS